MHLPCLGGVCDGNNHDKMVTTTPDHDNGLLKSIAWTKTPYFLEL